MRLNSPIKAEHKEIQSLCSAGVGSETFLLKHESKEQANTMPYVQKFIFFWKAIRTLLCSSGLILLILQVTGSIISYETG
jgi:hypothetical protein